MHWGQNTNIKKVYTKDPKKYKTAKPINNMFLELDVMKAFLTLYPREEPVGIFCTFGEMLDILPVLEPI